MKDSLEKYIEKERSNMDTYSPNGEQWEKLNKKRTGSKKKKGRKPFVYLSVMAAILVVGLLIITNWNNDNESSKLAIESNADYRTDSSDKIIPTQEIYWNQQQPIEWKYEKSNQTPIDFSNVLVNLDVDQVGLSLGYDFANANYGFRVVDTHVGRGRGTNTNQSGFMSIRDNNDRIIQQYDVDSYYEQYDEFIENTFETPLEKPLSTFGLDVDGAAYSNTRRFLNSGYLPPKDAVKLEEMVNYFDYNLPTPEGKHPLRVSTELGKCPWEEKHLLLEVAVQGEEIAKADLPASNLTFLLDVSGSMDSADKLPLLKKSLHLLVNELTDEDHISIVVYAGAAGVVLPSTSGSQKGIIHEAIENLAAGGSTAGGEGIELAYKIANENFDREGNNRVILATDGDFNVGISDDLELTKLIEKKRETGVFLSVLGLGTGNLQSSKMEKLADNGNGNYNYIDNLFEAKKVLVNEMGGTLVTIAKDVKFQLEFNPEVVKSYRLIGYENRLLQTRDFDDDKKDAGELGAGHSVIAFYEIELTDSLVMQDVSDLRYQHSISNRSKRVSDELALIKLRYKDSNSDKSKLIEEVVKNSVDLNLSESFYFASAVAEYGMLLRESEYIGNGSFEEVYKRAERNMGLDEKGYRKDFLRLIKKASQITEQYKTKHSSQNK